MIRYVVAAHNPHAHLFQITLYFSNNNQRSVQVFLPNWTPGSYMIRDFCKNVRAVRASCDNSPQVLRQINKNTWETPALAGNWVIEYEVYAFDLSVRGAFLDGERAFFDGASLLMAVVGQEQAACELFFRLPESWNCAIALPQDEHGTYHAPDYAALIDAPLEAGCLKRIAFEAEGIAHEIVLSGSHEHLDAERLRDDVQRICSEHIRLFRQPAPFERYTFLLHVTDNAYGGLEHRASTALLAARHCLPSTRRDDNRDDYITLLGLFSHEYFHAWNVKAIKPQVFQPYDLQQETYTEQLWAVEGITSYYDDLALVRSGVIAPEEYFKLLLKNIDRVHQGSGRFHQSLAQSSFNAWTKYYKQDENSSNAIVSYYQKGALAALCLDLRIRRATAHAASLDDVMRLLYADYRANGQGLADDAWQAAAEKIAGEDLSDFFQAAIHGTDDLPLAQELAAYGLELRFAAVEQSGIVETFPDAPCPTLDFGAQLETVPAGKSIVRIANGSHAEQAGLAIKDIILALDRCGASEFDHTWRQVRTGDKVSVHYLRHNRLYKTCFTAAARHPQHALLKIHAQGKWDNWLT
ncbi:MAG: M61 family peptidase [Neisseria sp.]|nr:M61 family peptidase [Neisseria sp.]